MWCLTSWSLGFYIASPTQHLCLEEAGMWCLTGLENGKQVVKGTGMVGHKSPSTKRLVVKSLSDIETSICANIPFSKWLS